MRYPVFLCGDQIEFERRHAGTPPKERPDWPLPSFDAQDWAEAFVKAARDHGWLDKIDEEIMRTWFANALMRGYDESAARPSLRKRPVAFRVKSLWGFWLYFNDEQEAAQAAEARQIDYQGLYVRDGT